jgi:hypothetical protein
MFFVWLLATKSLATVHSRLHYVDGSAWPLLFGGWVVGRLFVGGGWGAGYHFVGVQYCDVRMLWL